MTAKSPPPAAEVVFEADFVARLRYLFEEKIAFNRVIGLRIDEIAPGQVRGHVDMRPELIGSFTHQRLHGGVISAVLDAMAGLAVIASIGARHMDESPAERMHRFSRIGTIDLRVDYLRQATGERFEARAETTRLGSRVASARMEFSGSDGTLLATGSAAYIVS